jgi:hypothetical protein
MMGPEHHRQAEELLEGAHLDDGEHPALGPELIAKAQVQATLALAAVLGLSADPSRSDEHAWQAGRSVALHELSRAPSWLGGYWHAVPPDRRRRGCGVLARNRCQEVNVRGCGHHLSALRLSLCGNKRTEGFMIDLIMRVTTMISQLAGQLRSLKRDKRHRVADLLTSIADCINDIADQFRGPSRAIPMDRCFELRSYLVNLARVVNSEISEDQLPNLMTHLEYSVQSREFLNRVPLIPRTEAAEHEALLVLDAASGTFRATANLLRSA